MNRSWMTAAFACAVLTAFAAPSWRVTVDVSTNLGPIKVMNAVNNGPNTARSDQTRGNFDDYKALRIPFARVHDAALCNAYGGPHVVDISAVFPDFDAPVDDPASYDFAITDEYLANMRKAGTEPYYRLGQAIEHWIKKYGVNPPKDYEKWARICEHIVRHYNEGWAKGYRWNIRYWEIWNEPDGNHVTPDGRQGPTWTGDTRQFLELYKVTSLHLRKCFGDSIKIGGPAFCWWGAWEKDFLPFCAREKLPLDFYSWHRYYSDARTPADDARKARKLLDANGFTNTESHLNEWNYVKDWGDEFVYSLDCESGTRNYKCAASIAAVMINCQNAPVDMLMFYDARLGTQMNSMFDAVSMRPLKGYYPFLAWRRLRELGTQVGVTVETGNLKVPQLFACAATNGKNRGAVLIARYTDDNNVVALRQVRVQLPQGVKPENLRAHLTDERMTYTEVPLDLAKDGSVTLRMLPESFSLIEW